MLTPLAASCNNDSSPETGDTTTSADSTADTDTPETEALDSLEARSLVKDTLPDTLNFNGATFRTLSCNENIYDVAINSEETGSLIHDAVYRRDRAVEERLNVKFDHVMTSYGATLTSAMRNTILADDDEYQLYLGQAIASAGDLLNGGFLNWKEIEHIDFEKPWYNQNTIHELTVNDKLYILLGAMSISSLGYTYCMYYNKDLAEDYSLPDIYSLVTDGTWTFDQLYTMCGGVYSDLNANGKADNEDFYGFTSRPGDIPTFMWAFDQKILTVNNDLTYEISFNNEKTVSIIEKLRSLYNDECTLSTDDGLQYDGGFIFNGGMMFTKGLSLFTTGFAKDALAPSYAEFEADYGIIPYPKYDEAQSDYYTISDGSFGVMYAPVTIRDTAMTGAVVEAICAETWKSVEPVYYDTALKYRGARDEKSIEMLDIIFDARILDIAYVHDNFQAFAFSLTELVNGTSEFASYYAAREKIANIQYKKVIEFYAE